MIFLGIDVKAHRSHILLNKETKMIINGKDSMPIPNVYGYTMKPIVDSHERLIGRLDRIISNEASATKSQLLKIDEAFRISDVSGGTNSISTFSSSNNSFCTPFIQTEREILLNNKRTLADQTQNFLCTTVAPCIECQDFTLNSTGQFSDNTVSGTHSEFFHRPGQPEKMLEDTIALINVSLEYFSLNEIIALEPEKNGIMSRSKCKISCSMVY